MAKLTVRIAEAIQDLVPAPVQFVIAVVLLSVSGLGPIDLDLPIFLSAAVLVAGIGLLGTSLMPLVMSPLGADEWDELSSGGQIIVLSVVTVVLFGLFFLSTVIS